MGEEAVDKKVVAPHGYVARGYPQLSVLVGV